MVLSLVGENIILRKAQKDDAPFMLKNVWSDADAARMMLWQPTSSQSDAQIRIERTIKFQAQTDAFLICLKTDEPIGFAGVKQVSPGVYEDCGICIGKQYRGNGYGREALILLLRLVFGYLHADAFYYSCFTQNIASAALCRSVGFKYAFSKMHTREHDGLEYTADYYILESNKK